MTDGGEEIHKVIEKAEVFKKRGGGRKAQKANGEDQRGEAQVREPQELDDKAVETEITRLAKLGAIAYGRERNTAAKRLGVPVTFLDAAVKNAYPQEATNGQGRPLGFPEIAPWLKVVDGAALLADLTSASESKLFFPNGTP